MAAQSQAAKGKRRDVDASPSKIEKFDQTTFPYGYQYKPEVSVSSGQSSTSHTFLLEGPPASGPSSQRRRSRDHPNTQKVKKQKHYRSTISDAYAEHVLLAAQRIGRKRAAIVTGLQRLADREQEVLARENDQVTSGKEPETLEKGRLDRLASGTSNMTYYRPPEESGPSSTPNVPKIPKRSGHLYGQRPNPNPGGVNTPPPAYVFVNTSAARMSNPSAYSPGSILKTPSRPDTTMRLSQASNPPTPLDSLVDAARMMGESGYRTRRRLLEEPESPTAKRRKGSSDKVLVNRTSRLGRVKSGLDVLADQAAAVNKPQSSAVRLGSDSRTASDRKGKGKATSQVTDTMTIRSSSSRSRGSTRTVRPPSRRLFASRDELPSASSPSVGRGTSTPEPRLIALPTTVASGFVTRVGVNLRPVSAWGDRPTPDEDEEDSNSDSMCESPTQSVLRNETSRVALSSSRDPNALEANNSLASAVRPEREQAFPASVPISDAVSANGYDEERGTWARKSTHHINDSRDVTPQAPAQSSIRQTGRSEASQSQLVEHPACQPPPQVPTQQASPRESAGCTDDAAGSVFDEDAEGEEDEENTENDADVASRDHPSRSRSPPPPDPPGSDNGPGPSNEQDPDADADGDMDFDGKGTPPSGTNSATHRGGHHRQTDTLVTETSSTKASYTMLLFSFDLTMSTHSSGMQHSRLSIPAIVYNVNNRAFPQAVQFH